jgi:hypothetical protein
MNINLSAKENHAKQFNLQFVSKKVHLKFCKQKSSLELPKYQNIKQLEIEK